jgi:hypothetical protein
MPEVGWPRCGEIDIMEFVGKDPGKIHGNEHFHRDGKHASDHKERKTQNVREDFHLPPSNGMRNSFTSPLMENAITASESTRPKQPTETPSTNHTT